jgi:2-phospho-L-lactate/phosphoenolpyruvate guanylyltransferase
VTNSRDVWAILPIKEFTQAKQRLAPYYSPAIRAGLAQAMFEDVLAALSGVTTLAGILVLTMDPKAAVIARRYGARILRDGAGAGYTGSVRAAINLLMRERRSGILVVPGDVPLVTPSEIEGLIEVHSAAPAFSIVPAHDKQGSNAILCSPPDCVPVQFGNNSFLSHLDAARRYGVVPHVAYLPGIALDIDHPADVELFMSNSSDTRTWAFLRSHDLFASPLASVQFED